jgi:hypothetical protein
MTDQLRRRAACDRCTSQKLRCTKPRGSESCGRCLKAGNNCTFSVSRRGLRPHQQPRQPQTTSLEVDQDLEAELDLQDIGDEWSGNLRSFSGFESNSGIDGFDFENLLQDDRTSRRTPRYPPLLTHVHDDNYMLGGGMETSFSFDVDLLRPLNNFSATKDIDMAKLLTCTSLPTDTRSPPLLPSLITHPRPNIPVTTGSGYHTHGPDSEPLTSSTVASRCIRDLTSLSASLYDNVSKIPPLSLWANKEFSPSNPPSEYKHFAVDQTFQLTQKLIDIYPRFIATVLYQEQQLHPTHAPNPPSPQSLNNVAFIRQKHLSHLQHQPTAPQPPDTQIDVPSTLLLLSTHLRLQETFSTLFKHISYCIDYSSTISLPPTHPVLAISTPKLKVGSYAPPTAATVPMQVMLLLYLVGRLERCVVGLGREIGVDVDVEVDESMSREGDVEDAVGKTCRVVIARAKEMVKEMNQLRPVMMSMGEM